MHQENGYAFSPHNTLSQVIVRYQPSSFDKIFFSGFVAICMAMLVGLLIRYSGNVGHQMIAFGLWLVVAFMLIVLVHGHIIRGVHRVKVQVPGRLAVLSFGIAGISVLGGLWKSGVL